MSDVVVDGGQEPEVPRPRRGRRRIALWAALAVGVVFAGVSAVLALQLDGEPGYAGSAMLGKEVPPLELPRLEGGTVDLAAQSGKVVMINFFNSWCVPCQQEEPALHAFHDAHRDDPDLLFLGIVRDDTESAIRSWASQRDGLWPIAFDPGARAAVDFGTKGQPETYAVAPDGTIVAQHFGPATRGDLESMLAIARGEREGP